MTGNAPPKVEEPFTLVREDLAVGEAGVVVDGVVEVGVARSSVTT
jgi:hypothetical protein